MGEQNMTDSQEELLESEAKESPITADGRDRIFAFIYLALGYVFINGTFNEHFRSNIAVFTIGYTVLATAYMLLKGRKPAKEGYFWTLILLGTGIPYAWWSIMPAFQILALGFVSLYWTSAMGGKLMENRKTSQWVFCDSVNAVFIIPFNNIICHAKVLFGGGEEKEGAGKHPAGKIWAVGLGIIITVPILTIILPLLGSADSGFEQLISYSGFFIKENFSEYILKFLFSLPVSAYLFGLIYGVIHDRNTDRIKKENIRESGRNIKIIPDIAIHTALLLVCLVYLLFIGFQTRYLFSAFVGIRPEGFTYAEYARRGFFELCDISVVNLVILFGANLFAKTGSGKNVWLKRENVLLSTLTILLIVTAMSKMLLYISAYGLTDKRIITLIFMIWMFLVFICSIIFQYRNISVFRICTMIGAALFCLLCVVPVERFIIVFNTYFGF